MKIKNLPAFVKKNEKYMKIKKEFSKRLGKFTYKSLLDLVFGDYIIINNTVGYVCACVTCGASDFYFCRMNMQAGHFVKSARSLKYRYDENNVRPQCRNCNIRLEGNYPMYTKFMADKNGYKMWEEGLQHKRQKSKEKMTTQDYIDMTIKYYDLIIELCKKKKIKNINEIKNIDDMKNYLKK